MGEGPRVESDSRREEAEVEKDLIWRGHREIAQILRPLDGGLAAALITRAPFHHMDITIRCAPGRNCAHDFSALSVGVPALHLLRFASARSRTSLGSLQRAQCQLTA